MAVWDGRVGRQDRRSVWGRRALLEVFEPRVMMSGSYVTGDFAGGWVVGGLTKAGAITVDGVGTVPAGSWANEDGSAETQVIAGTGSTFTVGVGGAVGLVLETAPLGATLSASVVATGIMNATKDVVAVNETVAGGGGGGAVFGGLDLLVNHAGAFTVGDLEGTWSVTGADFRGTVTINALGQVTGGVMVRQANQKTAAIIGGTATLNANGTGTLALNTKFTGVDGAYATVAFEVTMNGAKDVVVASNANIGQPAVPSGTGPAALTVLVKSSGVYGKTDVTTGTWTLASALGMGSVGFTAGGAVNGTLLGVDGVTSALTGNYAISGSGTMVVNLTVTHGGTVTHLALAGAVNRAKNLVALDRTLVNAGSNSSLTVLINPANHVPTELVKAVWPEAAFHAGALTIDYATLVATTAAVDLDRDPLAFLITAVPAANGSMTITHGALTSAVVPGATYLVTGDTLHWSPSSTANGQVDAFSVRATDGTVQAANGTQITVSTLPIALVSAKALVASALETKAGTPGGVGAGKIQLQRVGGDITQAITVALTIGGTAQQGVNYRLLGPDGLTVLAGATPTVVIPAGLSTVTLTVAPLDDHGVDPTLTVVVTVAADPDSVSPAYAPSLEPTATVLVLDGSPTVTIAARVATINEGGAAAGVFIVTRTAAQGGNLNSPVTVNLAYSGTFDTVHLSAPALVTFAPGEVKKFVSLATTDNHIANDTQSLNASIGGAGFFAAGTGSAAVNVLDASPVVTIVPLQTTASEVHPAAGPGRFLIRRTGSTAAAMMVNFTTASGGTFGTLGTNYLLTDAEGNSLTDTVIIPKGKSSVMVTLLPVDDGANDPTLHATVVLAADSGPTYHAVGQITVNILNLDRRPIATVPAVIQSTTVNAALVLTYSQLVTLMGATLAAGEAHGTLQLKVTAEVGGTLQIMPGGGAAVLAPVGTIVDVGDSLVWSPPIGAHGNLAAFTLTAVDGTLASAVSTRFSVTIG